MREQNVFGVIGWKNSGKTTLIVALIEEFTRRGLRVSTIKHAHHAFDIDIPGKDSYQHRLAGAAEVLVASNERWALMHESRGAAAPPSLENLVAMLSPTDLVLVEGFKNHDHPKIEVTRNRDQAPLIACSDASVLAIVTDFPECAPGRRIFSSADVSGIADFIAIKCPSLDANQAR